MMRTILYLYNIIISQFEYFKLISLVIHFNYPYFIILVNTVIENNKLYIIPKKITIENKSYNLMVHV